MKYAKLFSILVFAITGLYGLVGLYFLPLAYFKGDLTRIGMLPEYMFGWTKPQPAIDPVLMEQASWEAADVLVIGDSFSIGRVWQTELVKQGLRVRTEHWSEVHGVCEDFTPWLRGMGFRGRFVVFESIEHYADERMIKSVSCKKVKYRHTIEANSPQRPPKTALDLNENMYSGRMSIGPQVWFNAAKYQRVSVQPDFNAWQSTNGATVRRVADGCALFSHPQCQDALFVSNNQTEDLGADVADNMAVLDKRIEGLNAIWVIVPNKLTAYFYPDKQLWNKMEQRVRSVNVLKVVRKAIADHVVDVYYGNDSHLSTAGYLLMGKEIYQNMQR